MKKVSVLIAIFCVSFFTSPLYAQEPAYYIGFGGSYALEDFDSDFLSDDDALHDPEIGDTWGINTEAGYQFTDWLSLQFDFDYLLNFESKNTSMVNCSSINISQKLDIMTFMLSPKFSPNLGSNILRPFLIGGLGVMYAKHDDKASIYDTPTYSESKSEIAPCARLGLGIDFVATKNVTIGLQSNYVWGFGDLDEIKFFDVMVGIEFHF